LDEFVVVTERYGLGKFVGALHFVKLFFNRLPELAIVTVLQNEECLRDPPELLQCTVQRVL
jgi:hypothetical protein